MHAPEKSCQNGFSRPLKIFQGASDPMERFLDNYIDRLRPLFPKISREAAHEIASTFLAFKFGLYANAVRECTHALSLIPEGGSNAALKKALSIGTRECTGPG